MTMRDYFARLEGALADQFPDDRNPGEDTEPVLHGDYVSRDNKRRIVLFVTRGPRTVMRVTYGLPVSEEAAPLFKLEGIQPDTEATFAEMDVPADQTADAFVAAYAAANNLVRWDLEIQRIRAAAAAAPPGKTQRMYHNLQLYWSQMRSSVLGVVRSMIHVPRVRSSSSRRRTSSARTDPKPMSRRSSNRRSSSQRKTSDPK
jgi:hypothetical protein